MKPSSENIDIEKILQDGESMIVEFLKSDRISDLSEDRMYIFDGMRRGSLGLIMTMDQFNQAGSIVSQILKLENDGRIKMNEDQKRIIQFTLVKIRSYRKQVEQITNQ